jgi:isoleucyl-tRNA synthetase
LQAAITLDPRAVELLDVETWAELCIVSAATPSEQMTVSAAPGEKCARCWKILPEVGAQPAHPSLCLRCADAVTKLACA